VQVQEQVREQRIIAAWTLELLGAAGVEPHVVVDRSELAPEQLGVGVEAGGQGPGLSGPDLGRVLW
jgi:hypothetical protein